MSEDSGGRENRLYVAVTIIIAIVIILTVFFSANSLNVAYIDGDILTNNKWFEDINERDSQERLFGLEKQASFTYKIEGNYPAYLTVTSIKTLFMMGEDDLLEKIIETINNEAINLGLVLDNNASFIGQRALNNSHKTRYVIFDGVDNSTNISETIKIIGETWNCGTKGTSIICIGFAQITDLLHNNSNENLANWAAILKDDDGTFTSEYGSSAFQGYDGLIYNVKCH